MTKKTRNTYHHIKSFEDFKNEKVRLYYEIKYTQKKLQLKYLEATMYATNPGRIATVLLTQWITPVAEVIKDYISRLFKRKKEKKPSEPAEANKDKKDEGEW